MVSSGNLRELLSFYPYTEIITPLQKLFPICLYYVFKGATTQVNMSTRNSTTHAKYPPANVCVCKAYTYYYAFDPFWF